MQTNTRPSPLIPPAYYNNLTTPRREGFEPSRALSAQWLSRPPPYRARAPPHLGFSWFGAGLALRWGDGVSENIGVMVCGGFLGVESISTV